MSRPKLLSMYDRKLIYQCKQKRKQLRDEANKYSNEELAKKFDVSPTVISGV